MEIPLCACGCGQPVHIPTEIDQRNGALRARPDKIGKYAKGHSKHWLKKRGGPPACACGCGAKTNWSVENASWNSFVHGHHTRVADSAVHNPRPSMRGDNNPMRRPEVVARISGDQSWRNRPENKEAAARAAERGRARWSRENNPGWKGGGTLERKEYVYVWDGKKSALLHRYLMAKVLGRDLSKEEVVHHVDDDGKNNNIENLHLFHCQACHLHHHRTGRALVYKYDELHANDEA